MLHGSPVAGKQTVAGQTLLPVNVLQQLEFLLQTRGQDYRSEVICNVFFTMGIPFYPSFSSGQPKPTYVPPRDLAKYSPLNKSLQNLPTDAKPSYSRDRPRKVIRTQSVPARQQRQPLKRHTSNEELQQNPPEPEEGAAQHMRISGPKTVSL